MPIFISSTIFSLPHKENKMFRWYTICICLLELLMTYVFGYHFQSEDPLIQLEEDLKWIDIFHPFLSYEMVNIIFVMIATNSKFHSSSITLYHSWSYFFLVFPFCYLPFFHSSPLFFFFLSVMLSNWLELPKVN